MGIAMSRAASGLVRALLARAAGDRHRILLTEVRSTDWQSLTFTGERHELTLRITGDRSLTAAERMIEGLAEAEFAIAGHIVADIAASLAGSGRNESVSVVIEALTISE
jgi:hypothetical protein